jgi:hypothetical protein
MALVLAGAVAVFALGTSPAIAMGMLVVLLVAIATVEHRRPHASASGAQ